MKRSSIFAGLVAIVLVLSIGAGGFYWWNSHGGTVAEQDSTMATPTAAMFVPKTATAMLSLLVNPDRLEALGLSNGKSSGAYLDLVKSSLLAASGLDYQEYIAPWVGDEITLAITSLDIDRDEKNGRQPGYLLVARTKDDQLVSRDAHPVVRLPGNDMGGRSRTRKARELLELFWQRQGVEGKDLAFASYNGIEIVSCSQPLDIATAVVGGQAGFVLFANYPKVLRDAINNVQVAERNITNFAGFQALDLTNPKIGLMYLNFPRSQQGQELYTSMAIALKSSQQGLLASTTLFAPGNQKLLGTAPAFSQPVEALQYIPEASTIVAGSKDLARLWEQLQRGISGYESLENLVGQSIADLQTRWGIDLPADLFQAVRGEYAAGLWPREEGQVTDWIFVAEKSSGETPALMASLQSRDREYNIKELQVAGIPVSAWIKLPENAEVPAAESELNEQVSEVSATVEEQLKEQVSEVSATADEELKEQVSEVSATADEELKEQVSEVSATADEELNEQAIGVSATVGKYEIFATSLEAMEAAINAPEAGSILTASNFQESIAPLAESNDGYFYLDWVDGKEIWERQVPLLRLAEIIGKPLFENLRTLTISSYGSEVGERKADIFFRLGK
ncbi:MAG: DUF3352 domain-containing protein [Hormoscilla sp. GM7CHS1pb]|nr:DUF3352 domain-containing protein [Hormoscilla sp. GM7CHS1pb]